MNKDAPRIGLRRRALRGNRHPMIRPFPRRDEGT